MSELYYIDILKKLVDRKQPIEHDELCCTRLSYEAFLADMEFLKSNGLVEEFTENNKVYYRATDSGIDYVDDLIRIKKYREKARKDPNSILFVQEKINSCWIETNVLLPENATEIKPLDVGGCEFTTVLVKDNVGHVSFANRVRRIPTGIQYLDKDIDDLNWHWSKIDFEPTHWMPIPQ